MSLPQETVSGYQVAEHPGYHDPGGAYEIGHVLLGQAQSDSGPFGTGDAMLGRQSEEEAQDPVPGITGAQFGQLLPGVVQAGAQPPYDLQRQILVVPDGSFHVSPADGAHARVFQRYGGGGMKTVPKKGGFSKNLTFGGDEQNGVLAVLGHLYQLEATVLNQKYRGVGVSLVEQYLAPPVIFSSRSHPADGVECFRFHARKQGQVHQT